MLGKIQIIRLIIKSFLKGMAIGLDWYYYDMFERKLPRWLAWIIGIILMPINWILVIFYLIRGDGRELISTTVEVMKKVEEARK